MSDDKSPEPSRIVFCERESGPQGPPAPGKTLNPGIVPQVGASNRSHRGRCSRESMLFCLLGEDTDHSRHEDEPGGTRSYHHVTRILFMIYQNKTVGIRNFGLLSFSRRSQKRLRTDSVLSKNSWRPSLTSILITKFVHDPLILILVQRTPPQESVAVRRKVEVILSHIASLDMLFAAPPGDVDEQRRRYDLLRYAIIYPVCSALTSFQQVSGHRGAVKIIVRGAGVAAARFRFSTR